jgi:hypothetical protein
VLKPLVLATVLAVAGSANATVLFSENFDSITTNTLNIGPGNAITMAASMDVVGEVDAVVPMNGFGINGLTSTVIDLDGSSGPGAVGKGGFNLVAGNSYTLSFDIGGAQRGSTRDNWSLVLRSDAAGALRSNGGTGQLAIIPISPLSDTFTFGGLILGNTPFTTNSISLTALSNTSFAFEIGTTSSDNIGPLLDNVALVQTGGVIPEPATWAMLIAGFGLVGTAMRRRRTAVAA